MTTNPYDPEVMRERAILRNDVEAKATVRPWCKLCGVHLTAEAGKPCPVCADDIANGDTKWMSATD
jgi:rubrerythrin